MITPVAVLCRRRNLAEVRMRFPSGPASVITIKSADVFSTTYAFKILSSSSNDSTRFSPLLLYAPATSNNIACKPARVAPR
jgi:hypothetical protein